MSELIGQGGLVLVAIAALSVYAWFVLIGQWLDLRRCERCCRAWERRDLAPGDARACASEPPRVDLVGRLLREGAQGDPHRFFAFENLENALSAERRVLLRHLTMGGELAGLTPLLGLLGTILGMLQTFSVLALYGARDVGGFAEGISRALVTTEAGLITALPILFLHGWLAGKAHRCLAEVRLTVQRSAAALWPKEAR